MGYLFSTDYSSSSFFTSCRASRDIVIYFRRVRKNPSVETPSSGEALTRAEEKKAVLPRYSFMAKPTPVVMGGRENCSRIDRVMSNTDMSIGCIKLSELGSSFNKKRPASSQFRGNQTHDSLVGNLPEPPRYYGEN